jgi:hypothetical protein
MSGALGVLKIDTAIQCRCNEAFYRQRFIYEAMSVGLGKTVQYFAAIPFVGTIAAVVVGQV